MIRPRLALILTLLFSGILAACASAAKMQPSDVVQHAAQVLQRASEQHVDDSAAPTLKLARAKYAAARKALQGPQPQQASMLAQEAIASTRLATIQAVAARATANRLTVQRQLDNMQQLAHLSTDK